MAPTNLLKPLLLLVTLLLVGCPSAPSGPNPGLPTEKLDLNGRSITVELALDKASRLQGLSDRPSLADDRGMLFVFPQEQRMAFVMRRCHFDIDIAFIDASGKVVAAHQMVTEPLDQPEEKLTPYPSDAPALFALELNAGGLQRYGLTLGNQLDLPVLELKRLAK